MKKLSQSAKIDNWGSCPCGLWMRNPSSGAKIDTWKVVHEDFGWHEEWQQGVLCMRTLLDFEQDLVKYGQFKA